MTPPDNFMLCQNANCPQSPTCLRLAGYQRRNPQQVALVTLNPSCYPDCEQSGRFYKTAEPVQLAWGIKGMIDLLPHLQAKLVRKDLIASFGKTKFYRFYREELPLDPQAQQQVKAILSAHGISQEPAFARYTQDYLWH